MVCYKLYMVKLLILSILFVTGCSTVAKISRSGYEEAPHKVLVKNGNIELRSYSELQLVETSMNTEDEGESSDEDPFGVTSSKSNRKQSNLFD